MPVKELARIISDTPSIVPLLMLPGAALLIYRAGTQRKNRQMARRITSILVLTCLLDGALLATLPRLNLSFGPVGLPWLGMILLRTGLVLAIISIESRYSDSDVSREPNRIVLLVGIVNLVLLLVEGYGLYFEPFNLSVSYLRIAVPAHSDFHLRVVQLSDLHVERTTRRERAVLDSVEGLAPDLILLTGDYLNLSYVDDAQARQETRALLQQLDAPWGVYAIAGTPVVDTGDAMAALFDGLDNIQVLDDDVVSLKVAGKMLHLVGVSNLGLERDRKSLQRLAQALPQEDLTVLLYHTPDLIETADQAGIDLYLAGHTHGGQVRLPWFGAILTASRYGKRYEAGLYQQHTTRLYVSRGIGMEGLGMPRVRFLCPPEIVYLELVDTGNGLELEADL